MATEAYVQDVLDRLDFNGTVPSDEQYVPPPNPPDEGGIVERLKMASEAGDLVAVETLYQQLKALPQASYWTENPEVLRNALLLAVRKERGDVIEFLLGQGVQPRIEHARLATERSDRDMLGLFLKHGWNINDTADGSSTPLLSQVIHDPELLSFFLSHGADPNARAQIDVTPLSEAVYRAPFSTIKLLFDHGGSVNAGQLLHRAVHRTLPDVLKVLDFLLQNGATVNKIMYEDDPVSYVCNVGAALGTPLHEAAGAGNPQAAQFLVERSAHLRVEDSLGGTPLQAAEKAGHVELVSYLRPITAAAPPEEHQFTRGQRLPGWERCYATSRTKERL